MTDHTLTKLEIIEYQPTDLLKFSFNPNNSITIYERKNKKEPFVETADINYTALAYLKVFFSKLENEQKR